MVAAATDMWGGVKAGIARLLDRGDTGKAAMVERRLEDARGELLAAAQADLATQARVVAAWTARLADLLEDDPGGRGAATGSAGPGADKRGRAIGDVVVGRRRDYPGATEQFVEVSYADVKLS